MTSTEPTLNWKSATARRQNRPVRDEAVSMFSAPSGHGPGGYQRWDIPAHSWSGADPYDETIVLTYEPSEGWTACTEVNQCTHRDLDADEIDSIRTEFKIEVQS